MRWSLPPSKNSGPIDILANVVGIAGTDERCLGYESRKNGGARLRSISIRLFICSKAVLPEMIRKKIRENHQLQFRDRQTATLSQSTLCDF